MAACNFSISFSGPVESVLNKARTAVQSQHGTFNGDNNSGQFDVSVFGNTIRGSYTVIGNALDIAIDSKPFLLPCSAIEGFLRSQLAG